MVAGEATPRDGRRIVVLAVRWAVPLLILGLFVLSGHFGDAMAALSDVSIGWAVPLVLVGIALPVSHAWRWTFLLSRTDIDVSLAGSARITALASLLNYAAPGFLGAPAKAVFARESFKVPVSRSLPTLAAEQGLDALMLTLAGFLSAVLAGPVVLGALGDATTFNQILLVVLAIAAGVIIAVLGWLIAQRLAPAFVDALRAATRSLVQSRAHRGPILALTVARWILDMAAVGLASLAVGLRLGVLEILLIANLSLLVGMLAPVPGGLGVREAVMATIAGVLTVSIPAVLALSVLHRAGLAVGLPLVFGAARLHEWRSR